MNRSLLRTLVWAGAKIFLAIYLAARPAPIESGSVITALGSQEVADMGDLLAVLRDYEAGDAAE